MSTVVEIEKALQTLPVEDARKVAGWLQAYLDETWDKQIEVDIAAGGLDRLWDKARTDIAAGRNFLMEGHILTFNIRHDPQMLNVKM